MSRPNFEDAEMETNERGAWVADVAKLWERRRRGRVIKRGVGGFNKVVKGARGSEVSCKAPEGAKLSKVSKGRGVWRWPVWQSEQSYDGSFSGPHHVAESSKQLWEGVAKLSKGRGVRKGAMLSKLS